ncbi:MAG: cell division ATP-binding protein FtsE [Clostridiaceae bacterium]|nr:cell division ATP-binding protein FtsE [Clostridiaceae bacterium]
MIEFIDVEKIYPNGTRALHDVSFSVESGEFVFVIGESGAGKSTIVKLLTCEEHPSHGSVILGGQDVSELPDKYVPFLRRKVGMIFQDFRLISSRTVAENVAYAMEVTGASPKEIMRRVPLVLSVVGLKNKADVYPAQLSGGEGQRVGIARALVNNPRLILADEPTGNLDPVNGEAIMALLERINRNGTTIIACTHDQNLVNKMQKRVLQLEKGTITRDEYCGNYYCVSTEKELSHIEDKAEFAQDFEAGEAEAFAEFNESTKRTADRTSLLDSLVQDSENRRTRYSSLDRTEEMKEILKKIDERVKQREAMRRQEEMLSYHEASDGSEENTIESGEFFE